MSDPWITESNRPKDIIHNVISEIISGLSSLHMPVDFEDDGEHFLDDQSEWIQHARIHFHQAIEDCNRACKKFEEVQHRAIRLIDKGITIEVYDELFKEEEYNK